MKEEPRIGFIGLGGMGRGLVQNLCAKGYRVMVHDIDTDKVAAAVEQGATGAIRRRKSRPNPISSRSVSPPRRRYRR